MTETEGFLKDNWGQFGIQDEFLFIKKALVSEGLRL